MMGKQTAVSPRERMRSGNYRGRLDTRVDNILNSSRDLSITTHLRSSSIDEMNELSMVSRRAACASHTIPCSSGLFENKNDEPYLTWNNQFVRTIDKCVCLRTLIMTVPKLLPMSRVLSTLLIMCFQ